MLLPPRLELQSIPFRGASEKYFVHEIGRPRFNEIDQYGVVWNGHYVNYFEHARLALCRQFGITMELLAEMGVFLPVYQYDVKVRKPVFPGEEIQVAVRPVVLSQSLMEFTHLLSVKSPKDGESARPEIRAFAKVQHVAMSKESGSILFELPREVFELLNPMREVFLP